jgi:hypothetical protein
LPRYLVCQLKSVACCYSISKLVRFQVLTAASTKMAGPSSGLLRRLDCWKFTDVSDVFTASMIFQSYPPETHLFVIGDLLCCYFCLHLDSCM